ncbi:MAG: tetratricopeptide repeat protein [Cyanobacteria bacterium P01_F01_bin.86]
MNNRRWLPLTEYALLLGSGAGAVASLATQNAAIASLPVTALVALGLLNRRRIDQSVDLANEKLNILEEQAITEVSILSEQVSALPTPEAMKNFQQAAMEYSDRAVMQCSQLLEQTKRELENRIGDVADLDLSPVNQELAQMQDRYINVSTTLNSLSKQVDRLYSLQRMEETEDDIAQLRTEIMQLRVNLETLSGDSKTAQATLQDAIRHLDRRLRQIPTNTDPNLLKGEVRELIKAVADLVPRREFTTLSEKFQTVQDTQETLRQTMERLQGHSEVNSQNGQAELQNPAIEALGTELTQLADNLKQVESRLEDMSVPFDITSEIRGTTATYLSSLQWQLALLEQQTQELTQNQKELQGAPTHSGIETPPIALGSASEEPLQWLTAFRGDTTKEQWSAIDEALLQALDDVSERLILVWPWSSAVKLDDRLIARFSEILEQGCQLEIGWCHPGNRQEGRLLKTIAQQWGLTTAQRQLLKSTLNQLLPLKQAYPEHFSFKILGTDEQFLICDNEYAIVGLQALPAASSAFSELDLRIRTTEPSVIDQLQHRFDNPDVLPEDATAYFNRAITRYDLKDPDGAIADFSQVIQMNPEDAVASNNRAIIWTEKKQHQRALEDLNRAIQADNYLFAARCNRGWILMNQGNLVQAITDFDYAIQAEPTSALAHFYRGTARQKLGDELGAIADYTKAIQHDDKTALSYCYRGAAYQRLGEISRAIADLEKAASLLQSQGNHRSLAQVTQVLSSLKQPEIVQPVQLQSA